MQPKRKYSIRRISLWSLLALLVLILLLLVRLDIPVETLKERYANDASRFVPVEGMSIHYRDEGSGVPLLLLHGTGASLHTWDGWTERMTDQFRVVRLDLPAFGLTGPHPEGAYRIEDYVRVLDAFVTAIGLDSFHLAGNSLGGHIAWQYALDHPDKLRKLVLVDAAGYPSDKPSPWVFRLARKPLINQVLRYITPRSIIRNNLEQVYYDDSKITDELVTRYHDLMLRQGNRQAFIDRAKTTYEDRSEEIKTIQAETLILWGTDDTWISPYHAEQFARDIPNAQLTLFENTGHIPMEESPEVTVRRVVEFLEE